MKRLMCLLLLGCLAAAGCSDDDPASPQPPTTLPGSYEVMEFTDLRAPLSGDGPNAKGNFHTTVRFGHSYVIVTEEGGIRVLNERGIGFRTGYVTTYLRAENDDAIVVDGERFAFTLTAPELLLESNLTRVRLERRTEIPDPDTWIRDFEPIETMNTAFQAVGDLAFSGLDIWISGGPPTKELIRIDRTTRTAFPLSTAGVAVDAFDFREGVIWGNEWRDDEEKRLFAIDTSTGETVGESLEIGERLATVVLDPDERLLWVVSRANRMIHLYSPILDEVIDRKDMGPGTLYPSGGTMANGRLYLVANGVVTVFEVTRSPSLSFEAVDAFHLPGHSILGITHDRRNFWVNALDHSSPTGAKRMHRIRPVE